jgi:hypothetical protein
MITEYLKRHELNEHYTEGDYGGLYLGFTDEFKDIFLPKGSTKNGFKINLLDQTDGKIYESKIYVAYEKNLCIFIDKKYGDIELNILMPYFYGSHHCPCHRKQDAQWAGASVDEDLECEGSRFLIESITPLNSDLILASETKSVDELESILRSYSK